jgi:DNA invertase Pin-like site-specific DNA recombinase
MIIGYSDNTHDVLQDVDQMYFDDVTYSNPLRPKLNELINNLKAGDTIAVKSISQLNWGLRNLILLVTKLLDKGVNIKIVDLNVDLVEYKAVLKDFANSDRRKFEKIKEATLKNLGRTKTKSKADQDLWNAYYTLLKNKSITKMEMAEKLGLTIPTFYLHFRKYEASQSE